MAIKRKSTVGEHLRDRAVGAASALLAVVTLSFAAPVTAQDEVMLYGDSLMAGYGLSQENGFASQLRDALAARGVTITIENASVSGDTSADGVARLDWSLAQTPDVALVGLGANDMLRGQPVDALEENLSAILDRFEADDVPVLLLGMMANRSLGADYVEDFDALYPDLAARYDNVALYPFFLEGVALEPSLNQDDGLHPNAQGVATIVDRITPYVLDLLDQQG